MNSFPRFVSRAQCFERCIQTSIVHCIRPWVAFISRLVPGNLNNAHFCMLKASILLSEAEVADATRAEFEPAQFAQAFGSGAC